MNDDNRHHWHDLILLALVALCLLLALLELAGAARDPRFTETPETAPAVQVDSVPPLVPPKIARHCVGDWGCIEMEVGR